MADLDRPRPLPRCARVSFLSRKRERKTGRGIARKRCVIAPEFDCLPHRPRATIVPGGARRRASGVCRKNCPKEALRMATTPAAPRCAALVGPYLSGKTTLLEALLFTSGTTNRRGAIKD